jgi:hypothetical protein
VNEKPAPLPEHYSTELKFVVLKMLEKDQRRRPDINHILNYSPIRVRVRTPPVIGFIIPHIPQ